MQRTILSACATTILALAIAAPAPTRAAVPSQADMAAVANFRLTDSFLKRDLAYVLDTSDDPCRYGLMSSMMKLQTSRASLDQVVTAYDAQPGVHAMLAKHGLTAREAILGGFAMLAAGMEAMSESPEGKEMGVTVSGHSSPAMRANVAFYKAHTPEIQQFHTRLQAAAKQRQEQNGGKMPACMQQQLKYPTPPARH